MTGPFDPLALDTLSGEELYRLLAAETTPWTDEDGISALQHQLSASLAPDLLAVPGMTPSRLKSLVEEWGCDRTFLDALAFDRSSYELLEAIKQFGKHCRHLPESPLHGHPAAVIYYAAIAAALFKLDAHLSQLSPDQLRAAFGWAEEFEGAGSLSPVFRGALSKLG